MAEYAPPKGANPRPFCRRHSSHFCPCVAPHLYERDPEKARDWDEPLRRKTEDQAGR